MTDLADLVPAYKLEVAPPGEFDTLFSVFDTDIVPALAYGFAQAQLDGFFSTYTLDPVTNLVDPDLVVGAQALVTMYAGITTLRSRIRETKTVARYKAGPVEYETQQGASVLVELLKEQEARMLRALELARRVPSGNTSRVLDGYVGRMQGHWIYADVFDYLVDSQADLWINQHV